MRVLMTMAAVLASACTSLSSMRPEAPGVVEAPIEIVGSHINMHVRAGGHEYLAVYDTGAEVSLMSVAVARELNIPTQAAEAGHGFGGDIPSSRADNVRVEFGSGGYTFPHMAVVDFTPMLGPNAHLDFILGQTLLPDDVVDIDPANHLLRWTPVRSFRPPTGATAMNMGLQDGSYSIPMSVDGVQGTAGIDVGSGAAIDLSAAFAQRLGLNPNDGATRQSSGVGGAYVSRATTLPVISIGGVEMHDVPVSINPGPLPSGLDINVGTGVLFRFQLMLDYAGRRLWLLPSATAASAPFNRDLVGMLFRRSADSLSVTFISDRGPAHDAGLAQGDEITMIDGVAVASWPAGQPYFAGEAGAIHHLTLANGRTTTLTLARYY